jgi:hypothetical protein
MQGGAPQAPQPQQAAPQQHVPVHGNGGAKGEHSKAAGR